MLPRQMRCEIERIGLSRRDFPDGLSEVRLRSPGRCSLVMSGENIILSSQISREETEEILRRMTGGSLYAFRDSICEGYVTLECGIRVGVCGRARYEGGRIVGVSEIASLVFRIPHGVSDTAGEIFRAWEARGMPGLLIYSPPGCGKTTALRSLAALIGGGARPRRVVVVDERCEFSADDYSSATVDILSGYTRELGIGIATRTMSAEVIMVDEIGGEAEARGIFGAVRCGVPLIASIHASTLCEAVTKPGIMRFLRCGAFSLFAGIFRMRDGFRCTISGAEEAVLAAKELHGAHVRGEGITCIV